MAEPSVRLCRLYVQQLERALDLPDRVDRHARVARRRVDVPMTEKILDHADVDALLQQMRREAMAKRVHGHGLRETGASAASRQARCTVRLVIGRLVIVPGKRQATGGLLRFK